MTIVVSAPVTYARRKCGKRRCLPAKPLELLAVARFVRDTPGTEAMGIAFVNLSEGSTGDRHRCRTVRHSWHAGRPSGTACIGRQQGARGLLSAQVDTARHYGIGFIDIERDGRVRLCYEGEAFRRVLALSNRMSSVPAALAITRSDCIDPTLLPSKRQAVDQWRAEVLDRLTSANCLST